MSKFLIRRENVRASKVQTFSLSKTATVVTEPANGPTKCVKIKMPKGKKDYKGAFVNVVWKFLWRMEWFLNVFVKVSENKLTPVLQVDILRKIE